MYNLYIVFIKVTLGYFSLSTIVCIWVIFSIFNFTFEIGKYLTSPLFLPNCSPAFSSLTKCKLTNPDYFGKLSEN